MPTDSTISTPSNLNPLKDSLTLSNTSLQEDTMSIGSDTTTSYQLEQLRYDGAVRRINNEQWISGALLLAFVLLAFVNFNHKRRFSQMIKAVFAKNNLNQLIREGNLFKEQISLVLTIVYFLVLPLFTYFSLELLFPLKGMFKSLEFFAYLLVFIISLWGIKVLIIKINSLIFKTPKPAYEITLYIFISNLFQSLILLPFITIFYYTDIDLFLFLGIGFYMGIYIIRLVREFMIGMSYSIFSVLHLFLYLCCLEIIPIAILIKLVSIYYVV